MNADTAVVSITRRCVRLVMRSLRAYPGLYAMAMLGATGFMAATVGSAWALGWITDSVILEASGEKPDSSDLGLAVAMIIGISIASGASVVARRMFLVTATMRTQRDWRRRLLHRYIDLPLRFYLRRPAGELLAHADADLEAATMVLQPLAFALSVTLLVVAALALLLMTHPLLALIAAVLFPTLGVMSRVYTRMVEKPSADVQRRIGEVSALAHESFDGALVVKTLGREPAEVQRMFTASSRLKDARIRVGRLRGTFEPAIEILPVVGTVALLVAGAWLVGSGSASPGDLVLASALFSLLSMPLEIVGIFLEEMPRSVVALERVDSVLDLPMTERNPPSGPISVRPTPRPDCAHLPSGPLSLEIDGLTVRLGGLCVLDGVSLVVAPGETIALVGSTGSGKSTLLETVAGLIDAASGSIRIGGMPLHEIDQNDLRTAVALVFQEAFPLRRFHSGERDAATRPAGDRAVSGDRSCNGSSDRSRSRRLRGRPARRNGDDRGRARCDSLRWPASEGGVSAGPWRDHRVCSCSMTPPAQ